MTDLIIVLVIIIAIVIYIVMNEYKKEPFYYFMPPSNCMETAFGKTNCYPPPIVPFYTGDLFYPMYPHYYPYYPAPAYLPPKKLVLAKK